MNEQEYLAHTAIANVLGAAAQAGDARKAASYAACFAEDGVLELATRIEGRQAIFDWMSAPSVIPANGGGKAGFVSHHLTTRQINMLSPIMAKVKTYWLVVTAIGIDHSGYYDDLFIKLGEEWLIAHRKPRTLWFAPDSLVGGGR